MRDLAITGGLKALAELRLGDPGREGVLYLRFHGFSIGVLMEKGKKRDQAGTPPAWYEQSVRRGRARGRGPRRWPLRRRALTGFRSETQLLRSMSLKSNWLKSPTSQTKYFTLPLRNQFMVPSVRGRIAGSR